MKSAPLIASLAANVVLAVAAVYLTLSQSSSQTHGKADAATSRTASFQASAPPSLPAGSSPADVQAWLRSAGASPTVRYTVAQAMLVDKYLPAFDAIRFPPGLKRWQRSSGRTTPEQREQMAALRTQREEEMKQLLGADYAIGQSRGYSFDPQTGIPVDRRLEIDRVKRDYSDARMKLGNARSPPERQLLEDAMRADIGKVLPPEEFELYQAYETSEAHQLQGTLDGLDIDDDTYLRIFQAIAGVKARNKHPSYSPAYRLEELQAIKQAAGAAAAAHVAVNRDSTFQEISKLYAAMGTTSETLLAKHEAYLQFHAELERTRSVIPGQLTDSQRTMVLSFYNRLTEGLSAAARVEFDRTKTGAFMGRLLANK